MQLNFKCDIFQLFIIIKYLIRQSVSQFLKQNRKLVIQNRCKFLAFIYKKKTQKMFDSSVDYDKKIQKQQQIYKRVKLLGTGSYGKAYLVKQIKTDQHYVIKQILMSDMSLQQQQNALRQAKILQALSHPNIVRFKQVYRTSKMRLNIVMEYANGGDLASKIKQAKKQSRYFDQTQILDWFTQICLGIKHIHDRKIIHRDLKAQNIFLTDQNIVKIGDFGVSRVLERTAMNARTVVGSPYYLSPQIIQNKPYSFQTDIWSLGALLYQMCALSPPFTANNLQFLALKIVKGSYGQIPNQYSYQMKTLIKSLLNTDTTKRPTINKILTSRIMTKRISSFLTQSKRIQQFSHTIIHNKNIFQNNLSKISQSNNQKVIQKSLLPPPNLKNIEKDIQNKSQIYTSNNNFQIQGEDGYHRPYTPLIGQQRKGPNNFFSNNRKSSKKLNNQTQDVKNKGLNFNDLIQIKPSPLEEKVKLPKMSPNPSFIDRKTSQVYFGNHQNQQLKQILKKQKSVPNSAFTKKRFQKQTNSVPQINNPIKQLQIPNKIQSNKDSNQQVIGKWKKPQKNSDRTQGSSPEKRLNPIQQKKQQQLEILNINKTQKITKNQSKPSQIKIVKRSESSKRIICPTKKTSSNFNKKEQEVKQDKIKKPVNKNIPKKPSKKEQSSANATNAAFNIQIVSQQAKKKANQEKQKVKKMSKNKSSSKIQKKKVIPKKTNIQTNISKPNLPTNLPTPASNNTPSTFSNSNKNKDSKLLCQPPKLLYDNTLTFQLQSPQKQKKIQNNTQEIMQEEKCNSDREDQVNNTFQEEMYSHQEFQHYQQDQFDEQNQQAQEEKLSLNLSDSCRNHEDTLISHEEEEVKKKQNINKMFQELENIQKMIAQANGIIQTLPMFGDDLNVQCAKKILQLSQPCQEVIREDDSQMQSILSDKNSTQENQPELNKNKKTQTNSSGSPRNEQDDLESNISDNTSCHANTGFAVLSNQQHLQNLKMNLQQLFGLEDILFIHKFLEQTIQNQGLDFAQKDIQKIILFQKPSINGILLKKYFRLIVTVVIMEQQQNVVN